jgi:hypothetical protein
MISAVLMWGPDAPVSGFTLDLDCGKKWLFVNSENLRNTPQVATEKIAVQNVATANCNLRLRPPCGKGSKHECYLERARVVG